MKKVIATLFGLFLFGTNTQAQTISGAGATFPYPIYSKWADEYKKQTNVTINYQSIGSGAGIKQIKAQTVVFGATDMPLTPEELEKDGLVQFPTVLGSITIVYNLDGLDKQVVLDGPTLAKIYLGEITNWSDKRIGTLNPDIKFPDLPIMTVYRSDGSGTTFVYTQYLSSVSEDWKTKIGSNTSVKFPLGVGGKGNEGVAATIKQIKGSIGYVEYAYVKQNKLTFTKLVNASGVVVEPNAKTFQAGNGIINNTEQNAWPITSLTYILIHKNTKDPKSANETLKFFEWAYKNGDNMALELDYIPLSTETKTKVLTTEFSKVKVN